MKASEIINAVRVKIGDTGRMAVSQYTMCDHINSVMRSINSLLCNMSSSLVLQTTTLTLVSGNANLPADFREAILIKGTQQLTSTTGDVDSYTFRIIGTKLYALGSTVKLEYKADFPQITTDGDIFSPDDLPLPYGFFDLIVQVVKDLIAEKIQNDNITSVIKQEIIRITARRDRTRNVRKLVF